MHCKFRIFIPFLCLLFTGCSFTTNDLKIAEQLLETAPDSALMMLQRIQPTTSLREADRALYGILLFQALDKNNQTLQPDSTINFSVNYYLQKNKNRELAISYYYKARLYKTAQRFDEATLLYLKALDIFQNSEDYYFLGRINSDMGDICSLQNDNKESLYKYQLSSSYFQKAKDTIEACYKLIDIGRAYRILQNPTKSLKYYKKAIIQTTDSFVRGAAYQEMGINYYKSKKFDSAEIILRKSLVYPYRGTSYAIRCFVLADVYYKSNQFDSAVYYSKLAFKYPTTFLIQRESYRILANTKYNLGEYKNAQIYLSKYQECTDSVRKIEIQTKSTVLEEIHETNGAFVKSKHFSLFLACLILIVIALSLYILFKLSKKNKNKEKQLEKVEKKLIKKHVFLKESLMLKIEETKLLKMSAHKKPTLIERDIINKEVYTACLHLDNWNLFEKLMNQTFNNLFVNLIVKSSEINHKELILCSLLLLDVPTTDMTIILECQQGSLYKLKQRLAQKFKLSGTKELEQLLQELSSEN